MKKLYPCLLFFLLSVVSTEAQLNLRPDRGGFDLHAGGPDRNSCYRDEAEILHWNVDAPAAVFGLSGIGTVGLNTQVPAGMLQNPALLTSGTADNEVNLTFVPWIFKDVLNYRGLDIADVRRLSDRHSIGLGFTFLDKRRVEFFGIGEQQGASEPSFEASARIAYAYRFAKHWSAGLTYKHGFTRQPGSIEQFGIYCIDHAESTIAFDFGLHYNKEIKMTAREQLFWQFGLSLNNLGPQVKYDSDKIYGIENFIRMGGLLGHKILQKKGGYYQLAFMYQMDRSLINGDKDRRRTSGIANRGKLLHKLGVQMDVPIGSKVAIGVRMAYQNGLVTSREVDAKSFSRGLNLRIKQFYIDFSQRSIIDRGEYDQIIVPMMIGIGFKHQMNKNRKAIDS